MNSSDAEALYNTILDRSIRAVAAVIDPLTPEINQSPIGLEAIALAATLKAFADVISVQFDPKTREVFELSYRRVVEVLIKHGVG